MRGYVRLVLFSTALLWLGVGALAQGTLEDYRRAEKVRERIDELMVGVVSGEVHWIGESNQLWYRVSVKDGHRFVLADAEAWEKRPAFDHERLAQALSAALDEEYTAIELPFREFKFTDQRKAIDIEIDDSKWRCSLDDYTCEDQGPVQQEEEQEPPETIVSPDEKQEACIRDFNVAVRPVDGEVDDQDEAGDGNRRPHERPPCAEDPQAAMLSRDGSEGDAYQLRSIEWSPDSEKLAVYRRQPGYQRIVHYVRSSPQDQVQPKHETTASMQTWSGGIYRKPGDRLDVIQPVLFHVGERRQILIDRALFPNPFAISRPVWREDSRAYTFEYNQRGHQIYRVLEVDAQSGSVRTLISEEPETFFYYSRASGRLRGSGKRWRHDLDDGRRILWMSERDGWNHLYLYDAASGNVIRQVTQGEWVVLSVDRVDEDNRHIYFRGLGMNPGQDPYLVHFYRVNFDGGGLTALTEADATHQVEWSHDKSFYADTYSRVDLPTVVELVRAEDGRRLELERGDMSAALAEGWRPPEVFTAKGRDGKTDIWGIIVRPLSFDEDRKYPVLEPVYAGPHGSFVPKQWGGAMRDLSTADLGFAVARIDGMGTNNRSKTFHDVAWKNLHDAGFPDRIQWHQAVAEKYPWYDIDRVGVYGTSAGGQSAMAALLFHGDFYDAAFSSSACHDNRMDKIWWNELWMSWPIGPHYEASSNVVHADKLKGKLFLAVGEMDTNVDPASTLQVVDALLRAHKDFDLLVVPNGGHGALGPDGRRRRHDFFLRHLMGVDPPDWNSGISLDDDEEAASTRSSSGPAAPGQPPFPDFFQHPAPGDPPFWWW